MVVRIFLLVLLMTLPGLVCADSKNVRLDSLAQIEVETTNAQGQKSLQRQPATLVVPGTVVIYTNQFKNEGPTPATNLVVTNPIPKDMVFLPGSLAGNRAEVSFSIDGGKQFAAAEQLFVTEAGGQKRLARAEDYTHIRWTLLDPLPPKGSGAVEFRARLK